jgi:hypothetical protein
VGFGEVGGELPEAWLLGAHHGGARLEVIIS